MSNNAPENGQTMAGPPRRLDLGDAAAAALVAASAQLRDDVMTRGRDRLLIDVPAVDLLAVAVWLDKRAWLLAVDPDAVGRLVDGFGRGQVDDDDELVPLDGAPAAVQPQPYVEPEPEPVRNPCPATGCRGHLSRQGSCPPPVPVDGPQP